jgi:hypothetical protein
MSRNPEAGRGFLLSLAGVLFIVLIVLLMWRLADDFGYVPHEHDTPVWIRGDWMVGEYRDCNMLTTTPVMEGQHYSADELSHLPRLYCAEVSDGFWNYAGAFEGTDTGWPKVSKDFHMLPVRYFGRLERPEKWLVSWRCQRLSASLKCKAID